MTAPARYWLFAGEAYYPGGGMFDLIDTFDNLDAAKARAEAGMRAPIDRTSAPADWRDIWEWAHITDTRTSETVEFNDRTRTWSELK